MDFKTFCSIKVKYKIVISCNFEIQMSYVGASVLEIYFRIIDYCQKYIDIPKKITDCIEKGMKEIFLITMYIC